MMRTVFRFSVYLVARFYGAAYQVAKFRWRRNKCQGNEINQRTVQSSIEDRFVALFYNRKTLEPNSRTKNSKTNWKVAHLPEYFIIDHAKHYSHLRIILFLSFPFFTEWPRTTETVSKATKFLCQTTNIFEIPLEFLPTLSSTQYIE